MSPAAATPAPSRTSAITRSSASCPRDRALPRSPRWNSPTSRST
jgi:hypothetical protein